MAFLDYRTAILWFSICVALASAVVDESEEYARFFNEPHQAMLRSREAGHHQQSAEGLEKYTRGSRRIKGSPAANVERTLQEYERKEAPPVSKDAFKLPREDWRDRLVLSNSPTSAPSEHPSMSPSLSVQPTSAPSEYPSMSPSSSVQPTYEAEVVPGQLMVGAYYYAWHSDDFHRGYGYLREDLEPPQLPELGEYDDRDSRVIRQHLRWSRRANIHMWITSWWGPNSRSDRTIRSYILNHETLRSHKISVLYETEGRIRESDGYSLHRIEGDMEFLCDTYFRHSNYYNVDDMEHGRRPVVFVYLSRSLHRRGLLRGATERMRKGARDACGKELYIVGDHVFGGTGERDFVNNIFDFSPLQLLDAVTNYDVYGSISNVIGRKGGTLTQSQVQDYYENEQTEWKAAAERYNCQFIPGVSAGYNDLSVRPRAANPPLSRSLEGQDQGSLFREALKYAVPLANNSGLEGVRTQPDRLLVVNSFNEWHEDTQIEPVKTGFASASPANYTFGFTYEGYGYKYLDILKEATDGQ